MNKSILGTIVGTALLGLAKAKSGNAAKISRGVIYSTVAYKDFELHDEMCERLNEDPLFYSEYETNVLEPAAKEIQKILLQNEEKFKQKYSLSRLPQVSLELEEIEDYHDDGESAYRIVLSLEIEHMVGPNSKSPLGISLLRARNSRALGPILLNDRELRNERFGLMHLIDDELESYIWIKNIVQYIQSDEAADTIHHKFVVFYKLNNEWVLYSAPEPTRMFLRKR